jgi:hypothetical protein
MFLPGAWDLPETNKVRFGEKSPGKQRAMYHEEHLLLVLHEVPRGDEEAGEAVFFWRKPDGSWEYSGRGRGLPSLVSHIDAFEDREDELRGEFRQAQDAEDYFLLLDALAPVLRAARNLHATLQAAREAVKLDRDLIKLRDEAYVIERGLELLSIDSKTALDYSMARKAEEQAALSAQAVKASHRLNILAAIFFPIMALGSACGMNIPSGLERSALWLFWVTLVAGVALGVVLCNWVLAKASKKATAAEPSGSG